MAHRVRGVSTCEQLCMNPVHPPSNTSDYKYIDPLVVDYRTVDVVNEVTPLPIDRHEVNGLIGGVSLVITRSYMQ